MKVKIGKIPIHTFKRELLSEKWEPKRSVYTRWFTLGSFSGEQAYGNEAYGARGKTNGICVLQLVIVVVIWGLILLGLLRTMWNVL